MQKLLLILLSLIIINSPLKSSETNQEQDISSEHDEQLDSYDGFTKWLIDNQDNFQAIIDETAVDTETKWFNPKQKEESAEVTEEAPATEEASEEVVEEAATTDTETSYHTVVKGDTLFSIAKRYELPLKDLMSNNNIDESAQIKVGDKLVVSNQALTDTTQLAVQEETSVKEATVAPEEENEVVEPTIPEYKSYKVKKGDTLYSIARNHNMTTGELFSVNEINAKTQISAGMVLKVKSNYSSKERFTPLKNQQIVQDGFLWPVVGRLLIPFGPTSGGVVNEGINIAAKKGTIVKAAQDGIVIYVGSALETFGNIILIQHANDWVSAYAHVDSMMVEKGQTVKKGDTIARVGNTGGVRKHQLHFELRHKVKPMDPLVYLNSYK